MVLTEREIEVYKLVSDDFDGRTQVEAAKKLGISQQRVAQILGNIEYKCPSLIPIHHLRPKTVGFDEQAHSDQVKYKF